MWPRPKAKQRTSSAATKVICRGDGDLIQRRGLTAVAFNPFDRDRGHAVTCDRALPIIQRA
jgi:hypothetical protein